MTWHLVLLASVAGVLGILQAALGGKVVLAVFNRVARSTEATDGKPTILAAAAQLRGGAWVGILERIAVYASLLAGYPEGIAFALAMKGLARYPELKATTSGAAERFIIGTFVSVLVSAATAGLALWIMWLL